jgi:hypothetical protein
MRQGIRNPEVLLRRTIRHIAVAVWERAAKMVSSCLPVLGTLEVDLLGEDFSEGDFDGRGLGVGWIVHVASFVSVLIEQCDRSEKEGEDTC